MARCGRSKCEGGKGGEKGGNTSTGSLAYLRSEQSPPAWPFIPQPSKHEQTSLVPQVPCPEQELGQAAWAAPTMAATIMAFVNMLRSNGS